MGSNGFPFNLNLKRTLAEINGIGIGLKQMGAPAHRLSLHQIHQVWSEHSIRKSRKVLDVGCGHQLPTGNPPSLEACHQGGLKVGAGGVNRCCVSSRARANDHEVLNGLGRTSNHALMRNDYELNLRPKCC